MKISPLLRPPRPPVEAATLRTASLVPRPLSRLRPAIPRIVGGFFLLIGIGVPACTSPGEPIEIGETNPLPVDSVVFNAADFADGWGYRRSVQSDLDGDGVEELLEVAADAAVDPDGAPLWEDGHRWAVRVLDADRPTALFAGFVPNGFVEAGVVADSLGARRVLVIVRSPLQVQIHDLVYRATGDASAVTSSSYLVERWVPGTAMFGG